MARVNALHKKGSRNMLDNYRPIPILPVVSEVFERILYNQLVEYLDTENLLSEHQFGFRSSHSTVSALLELCYYFIYLFIYSIFTAITKKKEGRLNSDINVVCY